MIPLSWFVGGLIVYYVGRSIYRLTLHPLSKFPGPKLAAVTLWYEAYYDLVQKGQFTWKIAELHKEYGPIIRISPHELHVIDPSFYEVLYRQDGVWDKYAWTYDAQGAHLSTGCTVEHHLHRKRRAALSAFLSKAAVTNRMEIVQSSVERLRGRVDEHAESKEVMNISNAIIAMTFDIANEYITGTCPNNLQHPDFNQTLTKTMEGSGSLWRTTKHFRFVNPIMKAMPLSWLERSGDPKLIAFIGYIKESRKKVARLITQYNDQKLKPDLPYNAVEALLNSSLPESEKSTLRLRFEVAFLVGAGSSTTSLVLRFLIFYLYSDPQLLARLRNELRTASQSVAPNQLTLSELESIPLLTGVLMEGLRLSGGVATRLARIAPDRNLQYGEWVIPAGTPVGMTALLMHLDDNVYPNAKKFDPDRWMDIDQKKGDVSRTFGPFSRGTRNCLGLHLAWAELYFTISMVVTNFNFDLLGTTSDEVDAYNDQFTIGTKSNNGVQVKVSRVYAQQA